MWSACPPARCLALRQVLSIALYRLGDLGGLRGWRPPVRTNAAREIARGAIGDPEPWITLCGIRPRSLGDALTVEPASVQDKWFGPLYLIKPILFVVLSAFWIGTGLISLTVGYQAGVDLMR